MSDSKPTRIGPWRGDQIRSLDQLCTDALRLESPVRAPAGSLIASLSGPLPYPDVRSALDALHAHPLYQTMKLRMPRALALETATIGEFRLVRLILRCGVLEIATRTKEAKKRTDKPRMRAYRLVERVEELLEDGTISFSAQRANEFADLLAQARLELAQPVPQAVAHPWIRNVAHALARHGWTPDGPMLGEIASALGTRLDRRRAAEYAAFANRRTSP